VFLVHIKRFGNGVSAGQDRPAFRQGRRRTPDASELVQYFFNFNTGTKRKGYQTADRTTSHFLDTILTVTTASFTRNTGRQMFT
jgi:hypothetical protein